MSTVHALKQGLLFFLSVVFWPTHSLQILIPYGLPLCWGPIRQSQSVLIQIEPNSSSFSRPNPIIDRPAWHFSELGSNRRPVSVRDVSHTLDPVLSLCQPQVLNISFSSMSTPRQQYCHSLSTSTLGKACTDVYYMQVDFFSVACVVFSTLNRPILSSFRQHQSQRCGPPYCWSPEVCSQASHTVLQAYLHVPLFWKLSTMAS